MLKRFKKLEDIVRRGALGKHTVSSSVLDWIKIFCPALVIQQKET